MAKFKPCNEDQQEILQQVISEHAQPDQLPEVEVERQKKRQRRFQLQVERLNEFLQTRESKLGSQGKEIHRKFF